MYNVGAVIRRIRRSQKMTIRQLWVESGINPSNISQIERNLRSPTIQTLEKLCHGLGCKLGDLFPAESRIAHYHVTVEGLELSLERTDTDS